MHSYMNSVEDTMTLEDKAREMAGRLGRSEGEVLYALSETDGDPTAAEKYMHYEGREIYSFQGKFGGVKANSYGFFMFVFDKQWNKIIRRKVVCIQNYEVYLSFDVRRTHDAFLGELDMLLTSPGSSGVACSFGEESLVANIDFAFKEEISKGIPEVDLLVLSDALSKGIGRSIGDSRVVVDVFNTPLSSDEVDRLIRENAEEYRGSLNSGKTAEDAVVERNTRAERPNITVSAPSQKEIVLKTKFVLSPVDGRRVIELLKGDRILVEVVDSISDGLPGELQRNGGGEGNPRMSALVENVQLAEDGGYNVVSVAGDGILCVSHGQGDLKVKVENVLIPAEAEESKADFRSWSFAIYVAGAALIIAIIIILFRIGR